MWTSPDWWRFCTVDEIVERGAEVGRYYRKEQMDEEERLAEQARREQERAGIPTEKRCPTCGRTFRKPAHHTWLRWKNQKHCSHKCGRSAVKRGRSLVENRLVWDLRLKIKRERKSMAGASRDMGFYSTYLGTLLRRHRDLRRVTIATESYERIVDWVYEKGGDKNHNTNEQG